MMIFYKGLFIFLISSLFFLGLVENKKIYANEKSDTPLVVDDFIEMRTGPGKEFPIFYVAREGENLELLFKRTEWVKVKIQQRSIEGWIFVEDLMRLANENEKRLEIKKIDKIAEKGIREAGISNGDFEGAGSLGIYANYFFTDQLSIEGFASQTLGKFSEAQLLGVEILHQSIDIFSAQSYFLIGTGILKVSPKVTLIAEEDRSDEFAKVGFGIRIPLDKRFYIRAEYNFFDVMTSRESNETIEEWKLGLSVFF
ncbi:MAG: hypothetical protein V4629_00565 [Pseudomonadota bacterium]